MTFVQKAVRGAIKRLFLGCPAETAVNRGSLSRLGPPAGVGPDSGVDLVHGVASSGAAPLIFPPVHIDGRPYIDGGVNSNLNAGLAAGADRVVVTDCLPIEGVDPTAPTMDGLMAKQSLSRSHRCGAPAPERRSSNPDRTSSRS